MNLDDYISEGFRQLQDPNFYIEVPTDLSESHMSNVTAVVSEMCSNGEISECCKDFATSNIEQHASICYLRSIRGCSHPRADLLFQAIAARRKRTRNS